MMKRILFFTALSLSVLLASCGGNKQNNDNTEVETVTIEHNLGTVEVPKNPQRVVVLDYSALENLDYIGVKPVAIPKLAVPKHLSKYKDDASITDVGSVVEVDLEKINEVNPDLIIIGGRLADFYDQLSAIAPVITANVIDTDNFVGALGKNLKDLGVIFSKEAEFDEALAKIEGRIEEVKSKVENDGSRALILLHNRGRFSAYGSGSRFGIIHDVLGVKEAESGLGTHIHGNPVSSEYVQKVNPDIIFIVDRSMVVGNDVMDKESVENKLVKQTNASKNNKIIYLNPETWYLAGGGVASVNAMIDEIDQAF